jgi:hypothetical protein
MYSVVTDVVAHTIIELFLPYVPVVPLSVLPSLSIPLETAISNKPPEKVPPTLLRVLLQTYG